MSSLELPDRMMNCHCGNFDHLSCLSKTHLITVREAQDGQRLLYGHGIHSFQSLFAFLSRLICVNLAVLKTEDEKPLKIKKIESRNNYSKKCIWGTVWIKVDMPDLKWDVYSSFCLTLGFTAKVSHRVKKDFHCLCSFK